MSSWVWPSQSKSSSGNDRYVPGVPIMITRLGVSLTEQCGIAEGGIDLDRRSVQEVDVHRVVQITNNAGGD